MAENKPQRLSEALDDFAAQGTNDRRWFLIEHQLEQVIISAKTVVGSLSIIALTPENEEEREIVDDCLTLMKHMLTSILGKRAAFLSYLSTTSVPERISREEV